MSIIKRFSDSMQCHRMVDGFCYKSNKSIQQVKCCKEECPIYKEKKTEQYQHLYW